MYTLWNMEKLKEELNASIRTRDAASKRLVDEMYGLVEEANRRHNNEMLKKDITIAGLEGTIKGMKDE